MNYVLFFLIGGGVLGALAYNRPDVEADAQVPDAPVRIVIPQT